MTRTDWFTEGVYPMGTNTISIDAVVKGIINNLNRIVDGANGEADVVKGIINNLNRIVDGANGEADVVKGIINNLNRIVDGANGEADVVNRINNNLNRIVDGANGEADDAERMADDAERMADDAERMADGANHVDHKKSFVARNGGGVYINATVIGGRQINLLSDSVRMVNPLVLGGVQVNLGETDNGDVNGEFERHQSSTETAAEDKPTQWNGGSMVINLKRADDKKT